VLTNLFHLFCSYTRQPVNSLQLFVHLKRQRSMPSRIFARIILKAGIFIQDMLHVLLNTTFLESYRTRCVGLLVNGGRTGLCHNDGKYVPFQYFKYFCRFILIFIYPPKQKRRKFCLYTLCKSSLWSEDDRICCIPIFLKTTFICSFRVFYSLSKSLGISELVSWFA